ncbi:pyridoxamine 5'-phosphate oxidase family protein [Catellatospora sichuanensis]|uniref:pyridoxamine 5'-phosphate oxidase family protein n=1 Tax=Catellatospora sichuanensis TaxID=1969805 RepID=UPI0011833E0A|nr:pyridoxamine 5'-phosphate oxidase family protein [Catellatospora sichuanensis]
MRTHPGEVYVQRRSGHTREGLGSAGMGVRLPEAARRFLADQRMLVIGGHDAAGSIWASPLHGPPGFLRAEGEREVIAETAPAAGDPLEGSFATPSPIGALAIEPATRRRMRINGTGHGRDGRLAIAADQIFANCPKHITPREVHGAADPGPPAPGSDRLSREQLRFVAGADTFFIATAADGHGVDVSHRGGEPGFVTGRSATTLSWPEYRGNAMYMTLGNLHVQPRCGLLFVDWTGARPALQLTGRASIDWDPGRVAEHPGAERVVDFVIDRVVETPGHALVWRSL